MLQALALYHPVYTVVSSLDITLGRAEKPRRLRGPYLPPFVTNHVSFTDQSYAVLSAISMSRLPKSIYST